MTLPNVAEGDPHVAAHNAERAVINQTEADLSTHISNTNNPHSVTKNQVGLGSVDNTADVDKPVSTAQLSAIDGKVSKSVVNAKGDILVGTADDVVDRFPVGSNNALVFADSSQSSGLRWGNSGEIPVDRSLASTNLNSVLTAGVYLIETTCTNQPTASTAGHMLLLKQSDGVNLFQLFTRLDTDRVFYRRSTNSGGSWTSWIELGHKGDIDLKVSKSGDTMTGSININRTSAGPASRFRNDAAAVNARSWEFYLPNDGTLHIRSVADDGTLQTTNLLLSRNGDLEINGLPYLTGTGTPEGVKTSIVGGRYVDKNGTAGAVEYIKFSGTGNTGWRVTKGDTGWRTVISWTSGTQDASNQLGTVDLTQYSFSGTGQLKVRRVNDRVFWRVFGGGLTKTNSGTHPLGAAGSIVCPAGFRSLEPTWMTSRWVRYSSPSTLDGGMDLRDGNSIHFTTTAASQNFQDFGTNYAGDPGSGAWASTLPGVPG